MLPQSFQFIFNRKELRPLSRFLTELLARFCITVYWGVKAAMNLPNDHRLSTSFEPPVLVCFSVIAIHALVYLLGAWLGIRKSRRE